jgi:hypothetical protein
MSKWKISIYLVVLFLAGVVTGAVLTHQIGRRIMMKAMRQDAMAEHWRRDLEGKLKLTPDQSQRIAPMIRDGMEAFRAVLHDEMQAALSNCNARITVELTPEQRVKFAQIEKEQQEFIHARLKSDKPATDE